MTTRRKFNAILAAALAACAAATCGAVHAAPQAGAAEAASADAMPPDGPPPEALLATCAERFASGDFSAAAATAATLARTFPDSALVADARFLQAKALVMLARFEDAIVVLDDFLKLSPDGPHAFDALMMRGEALVAASPLVPHFADAAISFAMALETDGITPSRRIDATLRLADALLRKGDTTGAAKAIRRLSPAERRALDGAAVKEGCWRVVKFRADSNT